MIRKDVRSSWLVVALMISALVLSGLPALGQTEEEKPRPNANTIIEAAPAEMCAKLDIPEERGRMDGRLFSLLWACGRQDELGAVKSEHEADFSKAIITFDGDVQSNNSAGEIGPSTTQSETSIAENQVTGTLCSSFNDSWEFFGATGGGGFTGFARSTDSGLSWTDNGAVGGTSQGDPSVVWRQADGNFYLATLSSVAGGLDIWRSTDDCQTFSFLSRPSTGGDDKEILAVDNNPASPNFGNLYMVWTDFGFGGSPIRAIRSTNGGVTWSAPTTVSTGGIVQGAWPAVAPNGDVFVAWLRYTNFQAGPITVHVSRSTNGGLTYAPVTSPLVNAVSPRDAGASSACFRPSLNGNIRYLASPQIAVDSNGTLHIVYSYDPDGFNVGDVVDVFYRQSNDSGATWSPEIQLNDDTTLNDQYFPTIQVSPVSNTVIATWYDRRDDPANLQQHYYKRVSTDGGANWFPSVRISDVASPIQLDPNLATCYHGDYDQTVVTTTFRQVAQWADDRNIIATTPPRNDPDVFTDEGNCFQGKTSGAWTTPFFTSTPMTGIFNGTTNGDPAVYNLSGTLNPNGSHAGTLTGVDPSSPTLVYTGSWSFNTGTTQKGTFRASITTTSSNVVIVKMGGEWKMATTIPGRFAGDWKICLR